MERKKWKKCGRRRRIGWPWNCCHRKFKSRPWHLCGYFYAQQFTHQYSPPPPPQKKNLHKRVILITDMICCDSVKLGRLVGLLTNVSKSQAISLFWLDIGAHLRTYTASCPVRLQSRHHRNDLESEPLPSFEHYYESCAIIKPWQWRHF